MAKYRVTNSLIIVDGVRYKRGDIVETEMDLGVRAELYIEPDTIAAEEEKPKRTRKTKTVKAVAENAG